jgi:uncharacterized protein (TIGR02757 family)
MRRRMPNELAPMSRARGRKLLPLVEQLAAHQDVHARLTFDPIEIPRRFTAPADIEVAGLIAAAMAYGRASVFKTQIERLLAAMGPHPAAFARAFSRSPSPSAFAGVAYRFNQPPDFAALVAAIGWVSEEYGTLGDRFGRLYKEHGLRGALQEFGEQLRTAPPAQALLSARGPCGLAYLLSDARKPGASKRWHLYLRWMVRGPDAVDLGVWRRHVPRSALLIPLDTHIARIARNLRLTTRSDLSWRTAEEITASLRHLDPADPVRFDFTLCHHGMSGACPPVRSSNHCRSCRLRTACGFAL